MKRQIRFVLYSLIVLVALIACTNDDSSIEIAEVHQSSSIQTALNQLRTHYHDDGSIN